jgi:hypothetical protein
MARKRSAAPAKPPAAETEAPPTAETEAPASEPTTDEGQAEAPPTADPGISEAEEDAIASFAPPEDEPDDTPEPAGKHPGHQPMPIPDKAALGNRIFAHPQADVLQSGFSVWIPGQEIHREDVDEEFWKMIHREGLVVTEATYKLHFPDLWNKAHPREQVASPTNAALEAIDAPAENQAVGEIK